MYPLLAGTEIKEYYKRIKDLDFSKSIEFEKIGFIETKTSKIKFVLNDYLGLSIFR